MLFFLSLRDIFFCFIVFVVLSRCIIVKFVVVGEEVYRFDRRWCIDLEEEEVC